MTCQQRIETWLEEHGPEFAACADTIHGMAELSGEEHRSATVLEDLLERHGFTVERGLKDQPTAFRAVYGNGPVRIGFMCEYDALASLQQDDVPYQQGNGGPGHGCGHNLLGAGSAAAGIALAQLVDEGLPATVVVYGTPAEETLAGKTIMIENGYFRDVDVCLAWHPLDHNDPGEVKFKAAEALTFTFHGRAAHACNCPENGRSALDAAELTNIGVNYLREHVDKDCYMHYCYTHGGERPNIVPDYAQLWYMVRAYTFAQMKELEARVRRVAEGACLMTDTTVEVKILGENHDSKLNFTLAAGPRLHGSHRRAPLYRRGKGLRPPGGPGCGPARGGRGTGREHPAGGRHHQEGQRFQRCGGRKPDRAGGQHQHRLLRSQNAQPQLGGHGAGRQTGGPPGHAVRGQDPGPDGHPAGHRTDAAGGGPGGI